jgi:hypothetical protein
MYTSNIGWYYRVSVGDIHSRFFNGDVRSTDGTPSDWDVAGLCVSHLVHIEFPPTTMARPIRGKTPSKETPPSTNKKPTRTSILLCTVLMEAIIDNVFLQSVLFWLYNKSFIRTGNFRYVLAILICRNLCLCVFPTRSQTQSFVPFI